MGDFTPEGLRKFVDFLLEAARKEPDGFKTLDANERSRLRTKLSMHAQRLEDGLKELQKHASDDLIYRVLGSAFVITNMVAVNQTREEIKTTAANSSRRVIAQRQDDIIVEVAKVRAINQKRTRHGLAGDIFE